MELRTLKYFLVVAQEENITRAAGLLHITQPTLSRQLMQLEQELGVKLLRRSKHSMLLTEDGMLLYRRAQEIINLAEKTEKELSHGEETVSGEISIGCGETQNVAFLAQLMTSFQKQYPHVRFDIFTGNADSVKERIENGLLDFGLLLEPVEIGKYHFVRMPCREKWCVLMRRDSPLAAKEHIVPGDLIGYPLLLPKRQSVRNELENWFGKAFGRMNVVSTCNLSYNNQSIMVEQHLGIALVHEFTCSHEALCLRPLLPEFDSSSVLVWKKNQAVSPLVARFTASIKNTV